MKRRTFLGLLGGLLGTAATKGIAPSSSPAVAPGELTVVADHFTVASPGEGPVHAFGLIQQDGKLSVQQIRNLDGSLLLDFERHMLVLDDKNCAEDEEYRGG